MLLKTIFNKTIRVVSSTVLIGLLTIGAFVGIAGTPAKAASVFRVPPTFLDDSQKVWQKLADMMLQSKDSVIILQWQGFGGLTYIGAEFLQAVRMAQAQGKIVILDVIGPAYSMHAFIACYADQVRFEDGGSLSFHAVRLASDKEVIYLDRTDVVSWNQQLSWFNQCRIKGLLTLQEVLDILVHHKMVTLFPGKHVTHDDN